MIRAIRNATHFLASFAVLVLAASPSVYGQPRDEGLVAYWSFDEGTGDTAYDYSGNENHGTLYGPTWTTGVSGSALLFDGVDDYVECGSDASLKSPTFSVEAWIKPSGRTGQLVILDHRWGAGYNLRLGGATYPLKIVWLVRLADGSEAYCYTQALVHADEWQHVVGTYDAEYLRIYHDGVLASEEYVGELSIVDGTGNLIIGRYVCLDCPEWHCFQGIIDEVRIYNKALNEPEIECVFGGWVSDVLVSQRSDASKLIDIEYSLSGFGDQAYDVTIQASEDGGSTWSVELTAMWGDVGDGVVPGEGKHIVWNPAIDIPGISGDNFMVRVIADDVYYADSNVFSIVAAGPGDLMGTVRDQMSGEEVVGAEVSLNGEPPVQTDEYGQFFFTEVPAGQATIDVSAAGYYDTSSAATMREDSALNVSILMTPEAPPGGIAVVAVTSEYSGQGKRTYYMDMVLLFETFTATIDWGNKTPGEVRFITPRITHPGIGVGDTWYTIMEMGFEFGAGGTLTVIAEAADGTESAPFVCDLKVIPAPLGTLPVFFYPEPEGLTLKYVTPAITPEEEEEGEKMGIEEGVDEEVPSDMPVFGDEDGQDFKFGATYEASATVFSDGTATGPCFEATGEGESEFQTKKKTKIAGASTNLHASGGMNWTWIDSEERWAPNGWLEFGVDVGFDVPPNPVPFMFGPVPGYIRGHIDISVQANLDLIDWVEIGEPEWQASLTLDPFPEAEAAVGVGATWAFAVEGYFGGGARIILIFPPVPPNDSALDTLQLFLLGGVRVYLFGGVVWEAEVLNYTWDLTSKRLIIECSTPVIKLVDRDYLHRGGGYAVFTANDPTARDQRDVLTEEQLIEQNVYPRSEPALTAMGEDLIMAWLWDDPKRTPVNRTSLSFSHYDAGSDLWSEPASVDDDGTADFHPDVAALPSGDVLAAWENVSTVLIEPGAEGDPCIAECQGDPDPETCQIECKLEELKSKTEIAVATYDSAGGAWTVKDPPLTDNTWLDRLPLLSTADDSTAMLVWVSNQWNDEIGTAAFPNDIHYTTYDGAAWSAAADAAIDIPSVLKSSLAYNGAEAYYVYIDDGDDNLETLEDRELYSMWFDGTAWQTPVRLTNDSVEDANPIVAWNVTAMQWLVVWYSEGDIMFSTDLEALTDRAVVADFEGESSGVADFELATGLTGQIAAVWQDASEDTVDFWYTVFAPVVDRWTLPQRLTTDAGREGPPTMEHSASAVFDATGELVVGYNKVQTAYETREVELGGEIIQVDTVPVLEQTNLYLLRHIVGGDLATTDDTLTLDPPNPVAGQTVTITATVQNLGDVPAVDLDVAFYDGDPGGSGTLIDVTTHGGPLVGGDEVEVSVEWLAPGSVDSHDIYVVVDPDFEQEDRDQTNNTGVLPGIMKPDVLIDSILSQNAGPNDVILTVRVLSGSGLATSNVDVTLRRDTEHGSLLQTFTITDTIMPGAFFDIAWVWQNAAPFPGGSVEVFAIADEGDAIDEFDEDNNVRSALVTNQPPMHPGDWDNDNDIDIDDFAEFPACMSGPWGAPGFVMPSQDCLDVFDLNADADVDLKDFASFQQAFTGGSE